MNYLGLDIGGSSTKFCIIDNDNNIILNSSFKYDTEEVLNLNTFSKLLVFNILHLIEENNIQKIGVAFPGVINRHNIVKSSPNLSFFEEINIIDFISNSLNVADICIVIDNDANIAAICERFFIEKELQNSIIENHKEIQNQKINYNLDNFLFITLGTGIGGAIFLNGKLYRGANGGAGEIGHTFFSMKECMEFDNLTNDIFFNDLSNLYKNKEQNIFLLNQLNSHKIFNYHECTIESFIGAKNFIKLVNEINQNYKEKYYFDFSELIISANTNIDNHLDNSIENYFLNLYGFLLAISVSSAMNLLDLNHIIIGGGCSSGFIHFENVFKLTLEKRLLPHIKNDFKVTLSKLGNLSGSFGAAILAKVN